MKRITTELFIMKAKLVHNNKYDYSKTEYITSRSRVCIICPIHGEFWLIASNHLTGRGCPKCSLEKDIKRIKGSALSTILFVEKAKLIHGDKYNYDKVNYINLHTKVVITCPLHGDFELTPANHIYRQSGCPRCRSSKGEKLIERILTDHNIKFKVLYLISIDTSINKSGTAYIDFYLPDYNTFIEYNGIQHYIPVEHFGGKLRFIKLLNRDLAIEEYCINNNILLLEINYNYSELEIIKLIKNLENVQSLRERQETNNSKR